MNITRIKCTTVSLSLGLKGGALYFFQSAPIFPKCTDYRYKSEQIFRKYRIRYEIPIIGTSEFPEIPPTPPTPVCTPGQVIICCRIGGRIGHRINYTAKF